ncbi:MAG: B12-binding domain-containing radical SAM protein [Deltaproteobacteria bacterium]|nr:B12-binding domain-containing radical SAM protein [Deltaproteobacteria bacterium]
MSRIILIRPPSIFSSSAYSAPVTPPLALAYLAANLLKHGHEVRCFDVLGAAPDYIGTSYKPDVCYRGLSIQKFVEQLQEAPDAIGMSAMFSQDWPHVADMIDAIHLKFPSVPIIVGGEHASATSEYTLKAHPAVKFVAVGEGEETTVEFADYLDGKKKLEDVGSLHYLGAAGAVIKNPRRARIKMLDDLPWPAWHLLDLEPYFRMGEGHGVERGRSMPLLATRGCPYECTFCSSPEMWSTRYVMRAVPRVMDEIEHYLKSYCAVNIDFFDLTAIVKSDWIMEFCQEIKKRGLKFTWQLPSGTRSEALTAQVLSAMAAAGCMNMTYAPESGSAVTLKKIKKRVILPRLFESIRSAKRAGIFVRCNLIIGFPEETRQDIWKTVWCALRFAFIGVDDTGLYPFSPYPGSELYSELIRKGTIGEPSRDYYGTLMAFMNLRQSSRYCENVGPTELAAYRLIGMSVFYGLSYILYPRRILRSVRNYKNHRSDTIFEERLFGLIKRKWLLKQLRQRIS